MNQKARHALRIVVGLYLVYLGWQLFDAVVIKGTGNGWMGAVLGPAFIIVGLLYAGNSLRKTLAIRKEELKDTDSQEDGAAKEGQEEEARPDVYSDIRIAEAPKAELGSHEENTENPLETKKDSREDEEKCPER